MRMSDDGTLAGLTFEQVWALCDDPALEVKLLYLLGQSAVDLSAHIAEAQATRDQRSTSLRRFNLDSLGMARIPETLSTVATERFYAECLLEQQRLLYGRRRESSSPAETVAK